MYLVVHFIVDLIFRKHLPIIIEMIFHLFCSMSRLIQSQPCSDDYYHIKKDPNWVLFIYFLLGDKKKLGTREIVVVSATL